MSAHEPEGNGPAHDSTPPIGSTSRMRHINVDKTGISMSGKTAITIYSVLGGIIVFLVSGWFGFLAINATKADLTAHDSNDQVHKIKLGKDSELTALPTVVKQNSAAIKKIETIEQDVITVKNGFRDYRTEDLADKAAAKVKDPDRKVQRWKQVRDKAKANLKARKPIREGLEEYL